MNADLHINGDRLLADLDELAQIGGTEDGGVHRPALSEDDLAARNWLRDKAEAAGLTVYKDGIGNVSAVLESTSPDARTVIVGSHLDTVPYGGRFDGALGVVAALEATRTIKEAGLLLPHHLEVISFTDEEGTWAGLLGSRAVAGQLTDNDFNHSRSGPAVLAEQLAAVGLSRESAFAAQRDPSTIKAFAEVHIEQGTRLEEARIPIGVVTAIVGLYSYWLTFTGRADHAGTTPLDRRQDALRGVAEFLRQSRELITNRFDGGVMNCGIVVVSPGAFNIVPERARLALEFRHHDPHILEAMREALLNLALHVVEVEGLGLEVDQVSLHQPAQLSREVIAAIEGSCEALGLDYVELPSYAAHDTGIMASIVPSGMFFVPSVGGTSHSPRELTLEEDCINAGNVMLHTILRLCGA